MVLQLYSKKYTSFLLMVCELNEPFLPSFKLSDTRYSEQAIEMGILHAQTILTNIGNEKH